MLHQSINFFKQTEKSKSKTAEQTGMLNSNDFRHPESKVFTASDLWNIQKNGRALMPRKPVF